MLAMGRKERLPSGRRGILSMRGRGMQRRRHFLSPADVVHLFLVVSTKVEMYKYQLIDDHNIIKRSKRPTAGDRAAVPTNELGSGGTKSEKKRSV